MLIVKPDFLLYYLNIGLAKKLIQVFHVTKNPNEICGQPNICFHFVTDFGGRFPDVHSGSGQIEIMPFSFPILVRFFVVSPHCNS